MLYIKQKSYFILVVALLYLSGCFTVRLAPSYDQAIVDGLNNTTAITMELLASVNGGSVKESYPEREIKYNSLIGKFDALKMQMNARPFPDSKIIDEINSTLAKKGIPIPDKSNMPSTHAVGKISETLALMKNTDKKQGITSTEVQAFKGQIVIYLDQALTVENFLKR